MGEHLKQIVAACVVFLFTAFILTNAIKEEEAYKLGEKAMFIIKDCEKNLPRNQKCTIHAVVEEAKP